MLNKIFKRYYNNGYSAGWQDGFERGSKSGVEEAKKVFIKLLLKEAKSGNMEELKQTIKKIEEKINAKATGR